MHNYDVDGRGPIRPPEATAEVEQDRSAEIGRALATGETGHLGPDAMLHLQRVAGNASVGRLLADDDQAEPSPVTEVVGGGGGQPLDDGLRIDMESRFGQDFSAVRVHADGRAAESARSVNAHAYTVGDDLVFSGGRYDPTSATGQRTIAHELTHVVQQRSGPVDGTPTGTGIRLSDPADRFEQAAEQNADLIMAAPPAAVVPAEQPQVVQREGEEEDEETAQGQFVQREGEEDEEEGVEPG